jgi:hypothetical protein
MSFWKPTKTKKKESRPVDSSQAVPARKNIRHSSPVVFEAKMLAIEAVNLVDHAEGMIPRAFELSQNFPNPFNPFLVYLVMAIRMLNNFPQELVAQVPTDHQALLETFDFTPTTLEMETHRRMRRVQEGTTAGGTQSYNKEADRFKNSTRSVTRRYLWSRSQK